MSKIQDALDLLIRTPASEVVKIAMLCGFYDDPDGDSNAADKETDDLKQKSTSKPNLE